MEPQEPIRVGAFELQHYIRKGGMGEVWRGFHLGQGVPVAIKVMTGRRARHPKYLQAFQNEVQAVAALDHPGIVMIFDHGRISPDAQAASGGRLVVGSPYLVMELASLGSLDQVRRQLAWPDLKGLLLGLLDALAHAHARDVIHRDLKPGNVLLCTEQDARPGLKLTDFGLANLDLADDDRSSTKENMAGTPRYMAPEVFEGRWRDYGAWTDLYALGCMIYEVITRRPLFRGQTAGELRRQHLFDPPPRLRPRKTLPRDFDRWLLRLVAKRPEDRYQRAADAAWGLLQLPEPEEISIDPKPGRGIGTIGDQVTTLFSAITGFDNTPTFMFSGDTEVGQTHIFPQEGLAGAHTYILPEEGLEGAETFLQPAVEGLAMASTLLFMSDAEWRALPRNRPKKHDKRDGETLTAEGVEALAPMRAPMPSMWWRGTSKETKGPSMRLVGAGLSLFGLRTIRLVGRHAQRDAMWAALSEVQAEGKARLIVLDGEAGIGKSRLAEWLCERAEELGAATALKASHSPITGPADGLSRMLARQLHCSGLSRPEVRRRIRSKLRAQGLENDYEWDALTEIIAAPLDTERQARAKVVRFGSPTERYVLVRRHLERLSRDRPVIVFLDDVQWGADALWFAQYMMRLQTRRPCPVLMVLTVDEQKLARRAMEAHQLSQILAMPGTARLDVAPLVDAERAELVEQLLGLEGDLAARVEATTHGNPLFAIQLVGSWVKRGVLEVGQTGFVLKEGAEAEAPAAAIDIWRERIDTFIKDKGHRQERAIEALEMAATLGMDVDAIEWRDACSEANISLTVGYLQALVQSGFVQPSEGTISFIHGLGRQALEDVARENGRWTEHNRICATMLQKRYADDHPGIAERLGRHFIEAQDERHALEPLLDGARTRFASGEYRYAVELLDRREQAMMNLSQSNAQPGWGQGWLLRAAIYRVTGQFREGLEWSEKGLMQAEMFGWETLVPPLTLEIAHLSSLAGHLDVAESRYATAAKMFQNRQDPKGLAEAQRGWGELLGRRGLLAEATVKMREALLAFESEGDTLGVARCLFGLWELVRQRGELTLAGDMLRQARALYESESDQVGVARCLEGLGRLAVIRGRFAEGSDLLQRALAFFEGLGVRTGTAPCLSGLADVAQAQGDLDAAEAWLQRAVALQREDGAGDVLDAECSLGFVMLGAEKTEPAMEILEGCLWEAAAQKRRALEARARLGLVLVSAQKGDWEGWDLHLPLARAALLETGLVDSHLALAAFRAAESARMGGEVERSLGAYSVTLEQWQVLRQTKKIARLRKLLRKAMKQRAEAEPGKDGED